MAKIQGTVEAETDTGLQLNSMLGYKKRTLRVVSAHYTVLTEETIEMPDYNLPAIQAPLKNRYKKDPKTAQATLKAEGRLGKDVSFMITSPNVNLRTGLNEGAGGGKGEMCPAELFLGSLAACAGVTMNAVASHLGIDFRAATISVEGDLDLRGTMGVEQGVPVGFKTIRLHAHIETDASIEKVADLLSMTEKYCVVFQSLCGGTKVSFTRD
jgi:uncharacterized OsmC-like protein